MLVLDVGALSAAFDEVLAPHHADRQCGAWLCLRLGASGQPGSAGDVRVRAVNSPLLRRAPRRHTADRLWLALLVTTFALVSAAAASSPLVVEAAQNASVRRVISASSDAAAVRQQPVVRITGGRDAPVEGSDPRDELEAVPGLGPPKVLGISFGDELVSSGEQWRSTLGPAVEGPEPLDRRLAAVDDPARLLVPSAAFPRSGEDGGDAGDGGDGGVWVDETAATALMVAAGDEVRVDVSTRDSTGSVLLPVAGVYALDRAGTRPADAPGTTTWRDLAGRLPQSTGFGDAQPPLLTDVATLQGAVGPLGEQVLWSVEAGLDPATPNLRDMVATSRAAQELPRRLPPLSDVEGPVGRYLVTSGIPGLQELSTSIASTAVARTRGVAWSALALAGLAVLVVTVVDDARRRQERRLEAALGLHPLQVGGLRMLEVMPPALLGGAVGVGLAWGVVAAWGPEGPITGTGVVAAVLDGATVVAVALLLVGAVSAVSAWSTGRLTTEGGPDGRQAASRRLPWRAALVAGAVATVVGVLTGGGAGSGLEVVAPLLVAASCGALFTAVTKAVLRRRLARGAGAVQQRALGAGASRGLSPREASSVLALRRLVAPGQGQDAVVVLLTAGLAMAGFVALADRSLSASVESKSAVLAGAASVVDIPSGQALALAPDAVPRPTVDNEFPFDGQGRPFDLDLPAATDVPVPEGDTLVWFDRAAVDGGQQVPVYVLDSDTAGSALEFGEGSGALVQARQALDLLSEEAAARAPGTGADPLPPVILVGERRGTAVGDTVEILGTYSRIRVQVVGAVPVFPGQGSVTSLLVADTDTYLPALQLDDPRYRPDGRGSSLVLQAEYWSSRGAADVASRIRDSGLVVEEVQTAANRRLQPEFVAAELVQGYQLAVAALLVVVAVVGLSVRADRSADRALPAAVVLRRTALGRHGVRRALALEQGGLVLLAVAAAALALVVLVPLTPALLDPAPRLRPGLDVALQPRLLGALVILVTGLVPFAVAVTTTSARLGAAREAVVLRDDR